MSLTPAQRRLHVRHLLLSEIGEPGQVRLCEATVAAAGDAELHAYAVAHDYLVRAGLAPSGPGAQGVVLRGIDPADVDALAGDPALRSASAAVAGAFSAVEAIKAVVGVGKPGALPHDIVLSKEPA